MIKVGDKVKVNLDVVSQNGLFESEEQQKQFDYLETHPEEVFTVASTTVEAQATYRLAHPVVGETSFYEEELILVSAEENKRACTTCKHKNGCLKRSTALFVFYIMTGRSDELTDEFRKNFSVEGCGEWQRQTD